MNQVIGLSRPITFHPSFRQLKPRIAFAAPQRRCPSSPSMLNIFSLFRGHSVSMFAAGEKTTLAPADAPAGQQIATFAGGCFWGLELAFQREPGVIHTSVGYTGGSVPSPSYEAVCSGRTGHAEAVQVYYDGRETDFRKLLDCFFQHVDPTTLNRQGNDVGTQYRSIIYYFNDEQRAAAEQAVKEVDEKLAAKTFRHVLGKKVATTIEPATDYYVAEDYHQQYLSKGGRFGQPQDASKGATTRIRCYG